MSDAPTVLIVDDDAALLDALPAALRLRMSPISVEVADSAASALRLIERHDYDAIVTDVKMPGMDGLALLHEIHRLRPETPTLLITGHGEHDLTLQALRGGAYDFIAKPIDRDYFLAAMQRALQTRALRREVAAQREALEAHAANLEVVVAERTRELQQANEAKDEFLGMISHEMRTPLTLVAGGVRLLRSRAAVLDDESRETILQDIENEAGRLTRIVEDLLVLARTELGNEILTEPVSLHALVERVAASMGRDTSRELRTVIQPDIPPVAAEQTYLERVITNLVNNADKYSEPGQPITIHVRESEGPAALVSIIDSGPGVRPEELNRIFERFYRAGTTSASAQGVGMGLTVCMRLIEAMSGEIWACHTDDGHFEVGFSVPFYSEDSSFVPPPGREEAVV